MPHRAKVIGIVSGALAAILIAGELPRDWPTNPHSYGGGGFSATYFMPYFFGGDICETRRWWPSFVPGAPRPEECKLPLWKRVGGVTASEKLEEEEEAPPRQPPENPAYRSGASTKKYRMSPPPPPPPPPRRQSYRSPQPTAPPMERMQAPDPPLGRPGGWSMKSGPDESLYDFAEPAQDHEYEEDEDDDGDDYDGYDDDGDDDYDGYDDVEDENPNLSCFRAIKLKVIAATRSETSVRDAFNKVHSVFNALPFDERGACGAYFKKMYVLSGSRDFAGKVCPETYKDVESASALVSACLEGAKRIAENLRQ